MRASEFITEKKSRKKTKVRNAAYGPGLYGGYGYFSTYGNSDSTGGDGDGGGESIHENITPNTIHKLADRKGVKWDNEPSFLQLTKRLTGKEHLDDLDQVGLQKVQRHLEKQGVAEGKVINTYLWHGSRQKIPMLEPRQSVDTGGAAGSNQNAIYATSDPKVAIAMGLTTAGSDTGMFPNDPQMVLFSGKIRKGEYVYLHKLPFNGSDGKPQFVQGGNSREFHSIPGVEGIKPIEIKEIPVNKYLNLIRKATPADLKLRKRYMKKQGVAEARTSPDQNTKPESGMKELQAVAETITDPENWAISMTAEPKLGINPQVGISEDTPKGIYFYPLDYTVDLARRGKKLPWGDNLPYIQLFQYDRSGEMTKETQVDPARLKQALGQYCPAEVIQQAIAEPEYDGTPYWTIYDCLSRLGKSDETNVVRWNKVLRDLGFTSVFDPGAGWIAYNEPTQGVVLDPRIIKQHKTISNKKQSRVVTPAVIEKAIFDTLDIELAANRAWQAYDPDGSKLRVAAKEYAKKPEFKQWFGKPGSEEIFDKAASWGRYGARELSQTAWVWYKEQQAQNVAENFADGKNPQDKGDAKRHGVPTKASVSTLRKVAKQGGRKGQLAHWMANMKAGKQK
jgi:hypothetical protein